MDLEEVAGELYGLPLDRFTEVRNARAKEFSSAGDRQSAAQVRKLGKPSQAAWIANRLARQHPQEIEKVLDLGTNMRRAQDLGQGSDLRSLSIARQALVQRLLRIVADDAEAAGVTFGTDTQRQLVATVEAAMADEPAGMALKAGRLTESLSHVGFGGLGAPELSISTRRVETTKRRESGGQQSTDPGLRVALEDAEKVLAGAQTARDASDVVLDQARKHHESVKVRRRQVVEELRKAEQAVEVSSRELERAVVHKKRETEAVRRAKRQLRAVASQNRSQRTK